MKKIINGKLYNTDTAKEVTEWSSEDASSDFEHYHEVLYRKRTGEYFIYGEGGPASKYARPVYGAWASGEDIVPVTAEQARQEACKHLSSDEYMDIFGPVSEGGDLKDIHVQVSEEQYNKLKKLALDSGKPMKDVVNQALDEFLK